MATEFDEFADEEWVDDEDAEDSAAELLVCPACRRPVHEDTQQCPHCGDWITPVYPAAPWKRIVWLVAVVLLIFSFTLLVVL